MIGAAFKKYAGELHFTVDKGVAYGEYKQYMLTFSEGMGWKKVVIGVSFVNETSKADAYVFLMDQKFKASHRITEVLIEDTAVTLIFQDTMGTIKVIQNTVEELLLKFTELHVQSTQFCNYCGQVFADGNKEKVLYNGSVRYMHPGCVDHLSAEAGVAAEALKNEGSVARGTFGAVLGALVGSIPWAVAYYFGWFVGWLGLLIGWTAKKGYELLKGRETRVKAVVILLVVFFAVIFAEYATLLISCWIEFSKDPELAAMELSFGDVVTYVNGVILTDGEIQTSMILDILMGWLFAGLGIFGMVRDIFKGVQSTAGIPQRLNK